MKYLSFQEIITPETMSSTPTSAFSSPSRRSPRVFGCSSPGASSGASGGAIGGAESGCRPNLSRRWSLDNLSGSHREGYVRDLRRQHQAPKDEGYPFMLTERRNSLMAQQTTSVDTDVKMKQAEHSRRSTLGSVSPTRLGGAVGPPIIAGCKRAKE